MITGGNIRIEGCCAVSVAHRPADGLHTGAGALSFETLREGQCGDEAALRLRPECHGPHTAVGGGTDAAHIERVGGGRGQTRDGVRVAVGHYRSAGAVRKGPLTVLYDPFRTGVPVIPSQRDLSLRGRGGQLRRTHATRDSVHHEVVNIDRIGS